MVQALQEDPNRLQRFLSFVASETQKFKGLPSYSEQLLSEIRDLVTGESDEITDWYEAMAKNLSLNEKDLFLFGVGAYFNDLTKLGGREGCSTFAVAGSADGPLVGKNRDCAAKQGPWQVMIRVHPNRGYGFIAMTSYGIPGVNSSGMNSEGLAVADTHVISNDIGIGLPRFVLEYEILTQCRTVQEALGLIINRPLMGRGNLILADKEGTLGVAELGHRVCATRSSTSGFLINTNHFTDPLLKRAFVDAHPASLKGTSESRYSRLTNLLSGGCHDLEEAKRIMSYHGNKLDSLCRHEELEPSSRTISTVFYLPRDLMAVFSGGYPCMATYQELLWE
jgi:hypothetical protein